MQYSWDGCPYMYFDILTLGKLLKLHIPIFLAIAMGVFFLGVEAIFKIFGLLVLFFIFLAWFPALDYWSHGAKLDSFEEPKFYASPIFKFMISTLLFVGGVIQGIKQWPNRYYM